MMDGGAVETPNGVMWGREFSDSPSPSYEQLSPVRPRCDVVATSQQVRVTIIACNNRMILEAIHGNSIDCDFLMCTRISSTSKNR